MKIENEKSITFKYLVAFISIVAFTILAQALVQYFILQQESYSEIINLAGRQRMLSQRLAKQSLLYSLSGEERKLALSKDILKTKELLFSTHEHLKNGSEDHKIAPAFTDSIRDKYLALDPVLKMMEEDVVCLINNCQTQKDSLNNIVNHSESFLATMNHIVYESADYSKSRILNLSKVEFILFTLIILLLIYEFFKIIIPIKQKLISQLNELRQKDQVITHSSKLAAIGELAAGIGHEINGPLTIIKGYLTRLKRESYKNNKNEANIINSFEKIEGSANQIENIVKGLRTFARKDDVKTVEFNLAQIVQDCIAMVEQIYDHYGIEVTLENQVGDIKINGNPGKIQQVMMNLLSNAKDALEGSDNKEIKVTLSQSNEKVQIKVSDSGVGISDAIKRKVFEPYFTTKEFGKGSGLGLSLSFNFIKEHNGTISYDSEPGHGTTFNIELPV
ncbi:ATP-binding protein [Halobacteriovorax sp. DPLXC-1]|uniref:ATP-binding protein n=1 Tax=Halobacteriovorax sp. DPLXC-1 TaxID=3110771 RepID=UPI002FEEC2F6